MSETRAAFRLHRWLAAAWLLVDYSCRLEAVTPPNVQEYHTRLPAMTVPFAPNVPGSRVRDVELYVSTDQGRTWTYVTQAPLSSRREENRFRYTMPADGSYWFAVRSIDQMGAAHPQGVDQLQGQLVFHLDRRPPLVQLKSATPTRPNVVGVEWDIRDEHFDPSRFTLEYRVPGQSDWVNQPLADGKAGSTGTQYWELTSAPRLEVRLRASDRAGNEAEATLALAPGATANSTSNTTPSAGSDSSNSAADGSIRTARPGASFINSLHLAIPFRLTNVGVSSVSCTDLWVTRDQGRTWHKAPKTSDDAASSTPQAPGEAEVVKRFAYVAPEEGLYGFTIVVRSGVGIGDADPRPGDKPARLVEVDITKPEVEVRAQRGAGPDVRNVTIEWLSKDKNLNDRPVSLLWSKAKDGAEWEPIITDLDARGRYVWTISDQGPFQFYVQARAVDRAGNIGAATHSELITVDLSRPKAELIDIVPLDRKK